MSAVDVVVLRLKSEEGFRALPYTDTEGHITIGYGLNVSAGISERVAASALLTQVQEDHEALSAYPWYAQLDSIRQSVCLDIAFNDGVHGLLAFPHMIAALSRQDWPTAATECHVENPELADRYKKLSQLLLIGGTT